MQKRACTPRCNPFRRIPQGNFAAVRDATGIPWPQRASALRNQVCCPQHAVRALGTRAISNGPFSHLPAFPASRARASACFPSTREPPLRWTPHSKSLRTHRATPHSQQPGRKLSPMASISLRVNSTNSEHGVLEYCELIFVGDGERDAVQWGARETGILYRPPRRQTGHGVAYAGHWFQRVSEKRMRTVEGNARKFTL